MEIGIWGHVVGHVVAFTVGYSVVVVAFVILDKRAK